MMWVERKWWCDGPCGLSSPPSVWFASALPWLRVCCLLVSVRCPRASCLGCLRAVGGRQAAGRRQAAGCSCDASSTLSPATRVAGTQRVLRLLQDLVLGLEDGEGGNGGGAPQHDEREYRAPPEAFPSAQAAALLSMVRYLRNRRIHHQGVRRGRPILGILLSISDVF
eukprot:4891378-Prymnesium_polylepis.2